MTRIGTSRTLSSCGLGALLCLVTARLERSFPDGVCDWLQDGMYSGDLRGTWLSFGPSPVNLVQ